MIDKLNQNPFQVEFFIIEAESATEFVVKDWRGNEVALAEENCFPSFFEAYKAMLNYMARFTEEDLIRLFTMQLDERIEEAQQQHVSIVLNQYACKLPQSRFVVK